MENRLKILYKDLVENRKHQIENWHNSYRKFYGEVKKIRARLEAGEGLAQINEGDKIFLKNLLYVKDNGITSRGQSVLSWENFQRFIENKEFLSSLEKFIRTPNKECFGKFTQTWSAQGISNNPLLVNRVAAACTLEVSTTADLMKFNPVFSWLINEKIISAYPIEAEQDWFSKNLFLLREIKNTFSDELSKGETDEFYLSQFIWILYANLSNPFSLKKQTVKYGAPGTGKTYLARQQASLLFDSWKGEFAPSSSLTYEDQMELIQFHPSFSYEDFMEGLRPVLDDNGAAQLTLQNGIFKEFCRNAGKWEIDIYHLYHDDDQKWKSLSIKDLRPDREKLTGAHWQYIFDIPEPEQSKLLSDVVPPFFFIIDEVNRAELSRVFGELMYCLEYRGVEGGVKTQYANLNNEQTGMLQTKQGYLFFIPTNIYLMGTMNTIDRSIESFDFALRRRFHWEEVTPDIGLLKCHLEQFCKPWVPLAENLKQLNTLIAKEPLLGGDYQIGHAYLMNMKYATSLTVEEVRKHVWEDCIRPLLKEYLRGTGKEAGLIGAFGKAFGV